jgi:hypothetical protein
MTGRRLPQIGKLEISPACIAWRSKSPGPFIAIVAWVIQA